jgi:hypothetical protein
LKEVVEVKELNETMKSNGKLLQSFNPAVWNAATNTVRYSALFRYIKQTNPSSWKKFQKQIMTIVAEPQIKTPNSWKKHQETF